MREVLKLGSFILIFIGTLGLLLNELMFDWGRTATIIFAAINLVGLVTLVSTNWITKETRNRQTADCVQSLQFEKKWYDMV